MLIRLDKRFIAILNEQGVQITLDQFKAAYSVRIAERKSDPKLAARRRLNQQVNEMMGLV
jgi:hypothetical protein